MTQIVKVRDIFLFDLQPSMEALPVVALAPVESEIQLCRTGAFYRADMGHFKVTSRTLEKMVFNAQERGVDIPINYYHLGNDPQAPINARDAAGWVNPKSLTIRGYRGGQALFGTARWTAAAVTKIKDGALRYISPEIVWSDVRMAASEAGPAGEPIGPQLTAAALVNDPFFTLNPVTLSRLGAPARGQNLGAPKRYNMMVTQAQKDNIAALLKAAKVDGALIDGLVAQIVVEMMTEEATAPVDAMPPEMMPAAADPAAPAAEGAAQQALAASREVVTGLTNRVKELEARDRAREQEQADALFARYQREGRYRVYAVAGTDPDGTKKAKALLAKGVPFFREVFDAIPALVGAINPHRPEALPAARGGSPANPFAGDDNGENLHQWTMAELKAKGLKMTDYARISAQFSRG